MQRGALVGLAMLGVAVLCAGCGSEASGVYVGASGSGVHMIQLVQLEGGKLSGRLEVVSINDQGRASSESVTIDGVIDGAQLVLTPKTILSDGSGSMTGQIRPGVLELSSGGARVSLRKADMSTFDSEVKKLRVRGGKIAARREIAEAQEVLRREIAEAQAVLDEVSADLNRVSGAQALIGQKLDEAREQYARIDDALDRAHRAQQSLQQHPDGGFRAGEVAAKAGAIRAERERIHMLLVGLRQDLNAEVAKAARALAGVQKFCEIGRTERRDPEFTKLCASAADYEEQRKGIVETLRPQFVAAEAAYRGTT